MNKSQCQHMDFCNMSVDDLASNLADIKASMAQYGHDELAGIEAPEWLQEARRAAARELNEKIRDQRASTLKRMKMTRENLRTAEEKRAALDHQIADMEKQLND